MGIIITKPMKLQLIATFKLNFERIVETLSLICIYRSCLEFT